MLHQNELSHKNELGPIWKLLKRSFRWNQARFCGFIRLGAAINWIYMVSNDNCGTDVMRCRKIRQGAMRGWWESCFSWWLDFAKKGEDSFFAIIFDLSIQIIIQWRDRTITYILPSCRTNNPNIQETSSHEFWFSSTFLYVSLVPPPSFPHLLSFSSFTFYFLFFLQLLVSNFLSTFSTQLLVALT